MCEGVEKLNESQRGKKTRQKKEQICPKDRTERHRTFNGEILVEHRRTEEEMEKELCHY